MNIFVLTRPKILALRSSYPELRWTRAFWLVLKAGADLPKEEDVLKELPSRVRKDPKPNNILSSLGKSESSFALRVPEDEDDDLDYVFCCWGVFYLDMKLDDIEDSDSEYSYSSEYSMESGESTVHKDIPPRDEVKYDCQQFGRVMNMMDGADSDVGFLQ